MTTTAIGFSNKYYTLWQIEEETRPLGNGCNYVVTHYYYIKNISFDKDKALAKYPNASLDENLRGKTASWSSRPKEVWTNVDVFRFGKYKFEKSKDNNFVQLSNKLLMLQTSFVFHFDISGNDTKEEQL